MEYLHAIAVGTPFLYCHPDVKSQEDFAYQRALNMSYHTYILYSKRIDRFYVGSTVHLEKRLLQHNNRESNYTAAGVPWILLWHTEKETRLDAERLERKLKNLTRVRKIRFIRKYAVGVSNKELLDSISV